MYLKGNDYEKFLLQLKNHEGERLTAYKDTLGVLTVGVGHNCITSPVFGVTKVGDKISKALSDELFRKDVDSHTKGIESQLPWIKDLTPPRQAVLYNMAFNLGIKGLLSFKNTLNMIKTGDYLGAKGGMLNSKWARQVGKRANQLAEQMESGNWVGV